FEFLNLIRGEVRGALVGGNVVPNRLNQGNSIIQRHRPNGGTNRGSIHLTSPAGCGYYSQSSRKTCSAGLPTARPLRILSTRRDNSASQASVTARSSSSGSNVVRRKCASSARSSFGSRPAWTLSSSRFIAAPHSSIATLKSSSEANSFEFPRGGNFVLLCRS